MDNYNYPPGADTPDAPWNEVDMSEEIAEKQWEIFCDRLTDEPEVWVSEAIFEQSGERANHVRQLVMKNLKLEANANGYDTLLGCHIRELVKSYTMPSEDEVLEILTVREDDGN